MSYMFNEQHYSLTINQEKERARWTTIDSAQKMIQIEHTFSRVSADLNKNIHTEKHKI